MKIVQALFCALTAAALGGQGLSAATLEVTAGATNVVMTSATYDTITVNGTLVISNAASSGTIVKMDTSETVQTAICSIGPDGRIDVRDYGSLQTGIRSGNLSYVKTVVACTNGVGGIVMGGKRISDATGSFDNATAHLLPSDVWASEAPTTGIIDLLRLNAGGALITYQDKAFINPNTSCDARILFNGGYLACANGYGATYQFQSKYVSGSSTMRLKSGQGGKAIILESVDGNPIDLRYRYGNTTHYPVAGTVKTRGTGKMCVWSETGTEHHFGWYLNKTFDWGHTGDFELRQYMCMTCTASDVLPCVANGGDVTLVGNNKYNFINLWGKTQHVNGVICAAKSILSNSMVSAPARLVFGSAREAGTLVAPNISGKIQVVKVGTGTLTISNTADFAELDIQAGTVRVCKMPGNALKLQSLTIASDAKLVADGVRITTGALTATEGDAIERQNGGSVVADYDVTSGEKIYSAAAENVGLVKTGAGSLAVAGTNALALTSVSVKEGTVRLADIGTTDKFWKIAITSAESAGQKLNLGPFRLQDRKCKLSDGGVLGTVNAFTAFTRVDYDESAVSALAEKQIMFSCTTYQESGTHGSDYAARPEYAMLGVTTVASCAFTNLVPTAANPLVIYYHIPNSTNPTYGYDVASQWDGWNAKYPGSWTIWSSPTGAAGSWVEQDSQSGQVASNGQRWYHGNHSTNPNQVTTPSRNPYPIQTATQPSKGFAATATVQVDAGATLDCSLVTGGQEIDVLAVDCAAGGGTLKNVRFGKTGTLNLTNFSGSLNAYEVPLAFEDIADTANLANWSLTVNGQTSRHLVSWANGKLVVASVGLQLIVK